MSILLKALKQAEADRGAARREAQAALAEDARVPSAESRDAVAQTRPPAGMATGAAPTMAREKPAYRGMWITLALALAVAGATSFGYWLRGMSSMQPVSTAAEAMQATVASPVPAAGTTPAALGMHEAGPMQLRLDRQLDTQPARPR